MTFISSPLPNQSLSAILSSIPSFQDGGSRASERQAGSNEFSQPFFSALHRHSRNPHTLYLISQQILLSQHMNFADNPAVHPFWGWAGLPPLHRSDRCRLFHVPQWEIPISSPVVHAPKFRLHPPTQAPARGNAERSRL